MIYFLIKIQKNKTDANLIDDKNKNIKIASIFLYINSHFLLYLITFIML